MPLEIDAIDGVVAIDLNLVFDSQAVTVLDVRKTELLSGFFAIHNVVVDTLKVAFASATPATGTGTFAEIVVEEGDAAPEFALSLVGLNGDLIPVEYEKFVDDAPQDSTAVQELSALPPAFRLEQNFPNPFNTETTIAFSLPESSYVNLTVYNATGQPVQTLVAGRLRAGVHRTAWDGKDMKGREMASGRYVARMVAEGFRKEIGMVLLK